MNNEELEYESVDIEASADVDSDVMSTKMMADYNTSVGIDEPYLIEDGYVNDDFGSKSSGGLNTHVVLYIVIGVCAIIGIVLGILAGKKAANK
ncbi:MAG: hypothetical protein IJ215_03725 [Clostridia bacterium]|nr:hypothetical protein [Clostridia bacterium]